MLDHRFLQEAGVLHTLDEASRILNAVIEQVKITQVIVCHDKEELGISLEVFPERLTFGVEDFIEKINCQARFICDQIGTGDFIIENQHFVRVQKICIAFNPSQGTGDQAEGVLDIAIYESAVEPCLVDKQEGKDFGVIIQAVVVFLAVVFETLEGFGEDGIVPAIESRNQYMVHSDKEHIHIGLYHTWVVIVEADPVLGIFQALVVFLQEVMLPVVGLIEIYFFEEGEFLPVGTRQGILEKCLGLEPFDGIFYMAVIDKPPLEDKLEIG